MLARANDLAKLEQALRPAMIARRVRRAAARQPAAGPAPARRLPAPVHVPRRRAGRCGDQVEKLVPVDAKSRSTISATRRGRRRRLARAAREGVRARPEGACRRDLAKYIRPSENTFDFALMLALRVRVLRARLRQDRRAPQVRARQARVPGLPNPFTSQLQVIVLGLQGLQIEQHAEEVMAYVSQLAKDFERFRTDFEVVGKHIRNAQSKYGEADRRLERLGARLERATDWDDGPWWSPPRPLTSSPARSTLPRRGLAELTRRRGAMVVPRQGHQGASMLSALGRLRTRPRGQRGPAAFRQTLLSRNGLLFAQVADQAACDDDLALPRGESWVSVISPTPSISVGSSSAPSAISRSPETRHVCPSPALVVVVLVLEQQGHDPLRDQVAPVDAARSSWRSRRAPLAAQGPAPRARDSSPGRSCRRRR